jgi:hypothetical protein
MITFGGVEVVYERCDHVARTRQDYSSRLRVLTLSGDPAWSDLEARGEAPGPREGHSAIYDPRRDRMLIFGGETDAGLLGEVWALSLSGEPTWTLLTPQGSPPPAMAHHSSIYDPVRDRMVVLGGFVGYERGGYDSRLWELSLTDLTWRHLVPTGTPPRARARHSAIYDPLRDRMIVFGGGDHDGFDVRNDLWVLHWGDPVQEVSIDVRPGDPANHLNPGSHGLLPVAVLSTEEFDATSVDPETVTLNGARVARRGNGDPHTSSRDVDSDGIADLLLYFRMSDLVLADGDADLWLDGRTKERKRIRGHDTVTLSGRADLDADALEPEVTATTPPLYVRVLRNPARRGELDLSYSLAGDAPASLELVDVLGRVVARRSIRGPAQDGESLRWKPDASLPGGVYFLRLRQGERMAVARTIVLR